MSYSLVPDTPVWLKLKPNKGTSRVAPQAARNAMAEQGYKHHHRFVVTKRQYHIPFVTVGKENVKLYLKDSNDQVICVKGPAHTLNLLFTQSITKKSAREKGVKEENRFIKCLRSGTDFVGRDELISICGSLDDVRNTTTRNISRPITADGDVTLALTPVRDAIVAGTDVSFKVGPEVRLGSFGLRRRCGFNDTPTEEENIRRARVLEAVGIPAAIYNDYFGYPHVDVEQELRIDSLLEAAFGECVYFHMLNTEESIVNDYINTRPSILFLSEGHVRGMDKRGNKNAEVRYAATIDDRDALVTFMVRCDNPSYVRPNILQIKVKYV